MPSQNLSESRDDRGLDGRIAIVTGAGGGIGSAIALLLAREGAQVVAIDRRQRALDGLGESASDSGTELTLAQADVTDGAFLREFMSSVAGEYGSLDIVINNAGFAAPPAPIAEFDEEQFDRLIAVNVKGVFNGLRACLPIMIAQGHGVVLNVGSVTSVKAMAGLGPYGASKQAVTGLTRAAALEAGPHGVRVNELLPGPALTPMVTGPRNAPTGAEAIYAAQVPLRRVSQPDEQAEAALFLVSPRSAYINGASLLVDGGLAWT